nr:cohesin subunit SA-2-like [Mirounga angustirostris]
MARRRSSILAQGAPSGGQDVSGPGTRRRGRPPRKHRKRKVAFTTEVTLFEMVALGKNSVQTAVEEWVQSYKEDRELALLDLISFFVQCCGCEGMVTAELYQSNQGQNVVHKMTEKFDQETGLYYKKFLAYPWILTIVWPEKLVTHIPLFKNGVVLCGFPGRPRLTEPRVVPVEFPARGGRPDHRRGTAAVCPAPTGAA